jgi:hypothetical protein
MDIYSGPPCKECSGRTWKEISIRLFRVEECMTCHQTRTTTDVAAHQAASSVVYIVVESWGSLPYGEIVGVYSNREAAEQEAAPRGSSGRPAIRYLVSRYEVLAEPSARSEA